MDQQVQAEGMGVGVGGGGDFMLVDFVDTTGSWWGIMKHYSTEE